MGLQRVRQDWVTFTCHLSPLFPILWEHGALLHLILAEYPFSGSISLPLTYALILKPALEETLRRSPGFSLWASLFSSVLCLWILTGLFSPDSQFFIPSQRVYWALPAFLLPMPWPRNALKATPELNKGSLCVFLNLGNSVLCCLMSKVLPSIVHVFCPILRLF